MLGAAFANISLVFSLIAFAALIALGAQSGPVAALTGAAAVLLDLVLAVVASTVAIAVFGPAISSRRAHRRPGAGLAAAAGPPANDVRLERQGPEIFARARASVS